MSSWAHGWSLSNRSLFVDDYPRALELERAHVKNTPEIVNHTREISQQQEMIEITGV